MTKLKAIERAKKLLAMSEGGTPNEAATAARMLRRTMRKYALTDADLIEACDLVSKRVTPHKRVPNWLVYVWNAAAKLNDCRAVLHYGTHEKYMRMEGTEGNVETADLMVVYFKKVMNKGLDNDGAGKSRAWKNAFRLHFAHSLFVRVCDMVDEDDAANSDSKALAVVNNARIVERFGATEKHKLKPTHSSSSGAEAGLTAADKVGLNRALDGESAAPVKRIGGAA